MSAEKFLTTEAHKQAETEFNHRADIRTVDVWKGDHSRCAPGHAGDGLCHTTRAWMLNVETKIIPIIVGRPTARRFQSTVDYAERTGKESEPAWRAKGWRDVAEIQFAKPSPAVVAQIREDGIKNVEQDMTHRKVPYADRVKAVEDFKARFDKANAHLLGGTAAQEPAAPQPTTSSRKGRNSDG